MISIFPRLTEGDVQGKESLICLPAQFKVLQLCQRLLNEDSLSEMDAVIGCPIRLFPPSYLKVIKKMSG